jgi:microcystin-dependent protein
MIVMWSGAVASVPTGWHLCDGTSGTPDLRDRFVVGAGSTYGAGDTGGATSVTLTVDQMPAHAHGTTDPGHSHAYCDMHRTLGANYYDYDSAGGHQAGDNLTAVCENRNTGTATTGIVIGNTGGADGHENRPPYYALAYMMRVSY